MENKTQNNVNDVALNYLREIYIRHTDGYSRDMIEILEDLRNFQEWDNGCYGADWFTPKKYIYLLSEKHKDMLKKHNVIDDDYEYSTIEAVFCFHDDIILELNKEMLGWWKLQYMLGYINKEYYMEEICNIIHKDFDVSLETQEERELFAYGLYREYPEGKYFYEYILVI
jgi:hypothetical protein